MIYKTISKINQQDTLSLVTTEQQLTCLDQHYPGQSSGIRVTPAYRLWNQPTVLVLHRKLKKVTNKLRNNISLNTCICSASATNIRFKKKNIVSTWSNCKNRS